MFPRQKSPPTISLPLYNSPPPHYRNPRASYQHFRKTQLTRYMALGLFAFLCLVTFFTLSGAAPLLREQNVSLVDSSFRGQVQRITEIYRGRPAVVPDIDHLIIVTGHAILLDKNNYLNDEAWVLESFQRGGQVRTFVDHVRKGVELAHKDPKSLLVFSGGQTRPLAGPRSEGQSYWNLANHIYAPQKGMQKFLLERVFAEEFARDSYENLLFSICRFHEITAAYPRHITVVGFGFKTRRFVDLHRRAIRFPAANFVYVGIDPPGADLGELERLEGVNAVVHFEEDPYGCRSGVLVGKRAARNPFRRMHGYAETNPGLLALMNWCPEPGSEGRWFEDEGLPWDPLKNR